VEFHECFGDGAGKSVVHRETFAIPIAGAPEALQLIDDATAVLILPSPHAFDERVAAERVARLAFLRERLLDDVLRRPIPAWSVPGTHRAANPCMRRKR
jgi:hypothetical protein